MDSETRKHAENLHRAALEREAQDRDTFLEENCAGDEELRRAVQALLTQSENRTNSDLRTVAAVPAAADISTQELKPAQLKWPAGPLLGHYRVLEQLGKGAMGVVYLAHDARLGRKIALKMLPSEFTQDETRLRRFEREARAASALNHPNVITVYEVGESNGIHFIATEFIEGNTLRRIMATEKIELTEKLRIAAQIAAALDSTHRAKVIHRDIKPENIMVRPDGLAKVLDFGLARLTPERSTSGDQHVNALAETQGGTWAGTPRYMSPEQVKGLELDSRSDIFSLGVVLYEMLTGRAPFASEKAEDLFDAICNEEPAPVSQGRTDIPNELTELVYKALEKNPESRFQTAGELQTRLDAVRQKLDRDREDDSPWRRHRGKLRVAAAIAAFFAIGLVWWLVSHQPTPRPNATITRLANVKVLEGFVSLSPDGRSIAYSSSNDGEQRVWIRGLEPDEEPRSITDGRSIDRYPIWSPDGERLAFVSYRDNYFGIWTISTGGGQPQLVKEIDQPRIRLTSWSKKRPAIYFEVSPQLYVLEIVSGAITELTGFDGMNTARDFSVSADEKQLAYSARVGETSRILVMPLGGGKSEEATHGGEEEIAPKWMSDGQTLIYGTRLRNIFQVFSVDLSTREPLPVTVGDSNYQSTAVSEDGKRIVALSIEDNANIFYWDLASRQEVALTSDFGVQLFPEVAPDGKRVLFQGSDSTIHSQGSLILTELDARHQIPLLPDAREAKWGSDNEEIAFIQRVANGFQLWIARASGDNPSRLANDPILPSGWTNIPFNRLSSPYQWSPDGKRIAYCTEIPGQRVLRVVSIDGLSNTSLTTVTDQNMKISSPMWSSRGDRIAYVVEPFSYSRQGKRGIYVIEKGESELIFEREERLRLLGWSRSGAEIFVALGELNESTPPQEVKLMEIVVKGGQATNLATIPAVYLHSVKLSPDGQQIAMAGRQEGRDNLMLISAGRKTVVTVLNTAAPTVYYSGLTWSPDGKRLFYSKQTSWAVASVVENFR
ncbi:MAG: protein kinase [Acidobacteriota bacterium]